MGNQKGVVGMRFTGKWFTRTLSLFLTTAFVVTMQPILPVGKDMADPAKSVVAEADAKEKVPYVISEIEDGRESYYGLQRTKFVDEYGKTVDVDALTGSEQSVQDGSLLAKVRGDNKGAFSSRKKARKMAASSSYTSPYVPAKVRDQGRWGVCWAFASTAAIEANMVKNSSQFFGNSFTNQNIDLSERHVAWFSHNTYSTDKNNIAYGDGVRKTTPKSAYVGGNREQVMSYLAKSCGMEKEEEAPYDTTIDMKGLLEEQRYSSVAQLHDAHLMGTYKPDDDHIDLVKAMVQSYGAAMVSYYSNTGYYAKDSNQQTNYYYPIKNRSNHAVCIVGWDDNYSASSFKRKAPGNGAWLIRNSWGSGWGSDGCFWLSYYDPSICSIASFEMVDTGDYGRTYQYTGGADVQWMSMGDASMEGANVYCAQGEETLNSIGVITSANSIKVEAKIYVSTMPMTSSPTEGRLAGSVTSEDVGMAGFHMLDLDQPVSLNRGEYFSIVVKVTNTTGGSAYLVTESNRGNKEKLGQTFYYLGNGWTDAADKKNRSMKNFKNACIFAYTTDTSREKDRLNDLVAQAEALNQSDLQVASDQLWKDIQADIAYARASVNTAEVNRALRLLTQDISQVSSYNLYTTTQYNTGPGIKGVEIYANGSTVKENGVRINYKTSSLYHNIKREQSFVWANKKKTLAKLSYKGKYIVAATTEFKKPELNEDGTLKQVDEKAKEIAKVSVNSKKVTISPKAEGEIYVWVLYYPKSVINQASILQKQTDYAVTKVHVSTAPKTVKLYDRAEGDPVANDTMYTSNVVPVGEGVDVYVKGTIGSITKKANTVTVIEDENIGYLPVIPAKYADYITVTEKTDSRHHFRIDVKPEIAGLIKDGKKLSVTVGFKCNRNTRKANFKLIIGNPVKSSTLTAADSSTNLLETEGIMDLKLPSAVKGAQTVFLQENKTCYDASRSCSDGAKLYKLGAMDQYTFTAASTVKILKKPDIYQSKVSIAAVKGSDQFKITAAKGTPDGTTAYLMIFHNGYRRSLGTGYRMIRVTVG